MPPNQAPRGRRGRHQSVSVCGAPPTLAALAHREGWRVPPRASSPCWLRCPRRPLAVFCRAAGSLQECRGAQRKPQPAPSLVLPLHPSAPPPGVSTLQQGCFSTGICWLGTTPQGGGPGRTHVYGWGRGCSARERTPPRHPRAGGRGLQQPRPEGGCTRRMRHCVRTAGTRDQSGAPTGSPGAPRTARMGPVVCCVCIIIVFFPVPTLAQPRTTLHTDQAQLQAVLGCSFRHLRCRGHGVLQEEALRGWWPAGARSGVCWKEQLQLALRGSGVRHIWQPFSQNRIKQARRLKSRAVGSPANDNIQAGVKMSVLENTEPPLRV